MSAATTTPAPSETAADTVESPDSGTASRRRRVGLSIVTLVIVVLAVAAGVLGWRLHQAVALDQARTQAAATARTAISDVLSYDYQTLDADLARGQAQLTPGFRPEYASVVAKSVRPVAAQQHVVTTATVPAVSVISATKTNVEVLLFVDQLTTSTKAKNVINVSRVQVTMTRLGHTWLISDLRAI